MFVLLFLNTKSSLHIMNTALFSNLFFANIFSQSVVFLLILLTVTFEKQKLLFWGKYKIIICSFIDSALGEILSTPKIIKKIPPRAMALFWQLPPCINRPQINMSKQKKERTETSTAPMQSYCQKIKEKNEKEKQMTKEA